MDQGHSEYVIIDIIIGVYNVNAGDNTSTQF